MKLNRYKNLVEATSDLTSKGYKHTFRIEEQGLSCLQNQKIYQPADIKLVEYHRFEGDSNPNDQSILFVIECLGGEKGIVISSYGAYFDLPLMAFMDKVSVKPRSSSSFSIV